jgi:hypothetical protein
MVLNKFNLKISDKVLQKVIENYTRESGVRELDRQLASIMRYKAKEYSMRGKVAPTVSLQEIEKILGTQRYSNEIYKTANMPGVAVGLAMDICRRRYFIYRKSFERRQRRIKTYRQPRQCDERKRLNSFKLLCMRMQKNMALMLLYSAKKISIYMYLKALCRKMGQVPVLLC